MFNTDFDSENNELEQAVLGALIHSPSALPRLTLSERMFVDPLHVDIFRQIKSRVMRGEVADLVSLTGDKKYLAHLYRMSTGIANPRPHAEELVRNYQRRELKKILLGAMDTLKDSSKTLTDVLDEINRNSSSLAKSIEHYPRKHWSDVVQGVIEKLDRPIEYVSTGLGRLDSAMNGGLSYGRSYCISARPKAGKTMIKGTIANYLRKSKVKFLYIAAEMGSDEIAKRMLGAETGYPSRTFDRKESANPIAEKIIQQQNHGNFWFVDAPRISISAMQQVILSAVKECGIKGFILDYLQLVSGKESGETIAQHQENVAQSIAEICRRENIWGLYSAQINREGQVRNGDGVVMAADWVYELVPIERGDGTFTGEVWLKCIASRFTAPVDIGTSEKPSFAISQNGTCFNQLANSF